MLQDFVYGYGIDLKDLKLTDSFYKSDQWFDFGDGKAAFSEYIDGYPANDPAIYTVSHAVNHNQVKTFSSNVNDCGSCVIYIPTQSVEVGTKPEDIHFYTKEEAQKVLYDNVIKALIAISKHTGFHKFTTKQNVKKLVQSAKNQRWTYEP